MKGMCPNDHGIFDKGVFCPRCGEKLVQVQEPGKSNQPYEMMGEAPCPACGFELDHGHQSYCPGCGHTLKWLCR